MGEIEEVTTVQETSGEDMLLQQIDDFRDKAKQLQTLTAAKERKVKELEAMVRAKEEKNAQLQQELTKKQEEADGIAMDVETQVDRMLASLKVSMDDLENRIEAQVANNQESAAEQTKAVKDTLQEMTESLDGIKAEVSDRVHSENVKEYRNIQELLKELDHSEEQAEQAQKRYDKLKGKLTGVTVLSVINMIVGIAAVALLVLNMFVL